MMVRTKRSTGASAPALISALARARLTERLGEALRIARRELPRRFDRLCALVRDVNERVDALSLTADEERLQALLRPSSRLPSTVLTRAAGAVSEFLLIPYGEVKLERPGGGESFVFTPRHAASAKRWFDQLGRKLAIDYEHQSLDPTSGRGDGLRPAAGWIGGLELREGGLWAVDVVWTPRAAELLTNGEYRYFSPVIYWTDEDQTDVAALGPVALTNDPAMRGVGPLAGEQTDEDDAFAYEVPGALPGGDGGEQGGGGEGEEDVLRAQLAARDAESFIERGVAAGKIVASTREDWRDDYLRDGRQAELRLSRAPVVLPPGRVMKLDGRGEVARLAPASAGALGERGWEAEDLAAYERAAAASRVRVYTGAPRR